ncbi:DNA replication and repair protein RecO [Rhizobiales bacterium GAS191]|nr:DNA replication and repair protein RecO [Rhizobiales bacterium GAS113]SEC12973.1 DNA replication and repair protein RecO [Rhizobiales bacterium GAS191]SED07675.1 DNA replication and repair protein RecO [Rhizobiales bacterium GAS188]
MQWSDEAVILGARAHGETSLILEVLTRAHGRHLGIVRGGRSRRLAPTLQPGNLAEVTWRARLESHLGSFVVELRDLRAAAMLGSPAALYAFATLAAHLRLLAEREPHASLYDALCILGEHLAEPAIAAPLILRFELALLAELGFGLDLSACAATGTREDLAFVSPKSGRAVSAMAGKPYRDRLFALPAFLIEGQGRLIGGLGREMPEAAEIAEGFRLTGFFLARHVHEPRGVHMPEARQRFLELALAALAAG